jgi:hypothetical protein
MFDQQDRDIPRQARHCCEDIVPFAPGNAGGRLIQQQHARPGRNGERDLDQALLAVRQRRRPASPVAAMPHALRHHQTDRFPRSQIRAKLIDLEVRDNEIMTRFDESDHDLAMLVNNARFQSCGSSTISPDAVFEIGM